MPTRATFGLLLGLGALGCVVGAARAFDPSTVYVAHAVGALGPISGWRCAQSATYTYDPRHDSADRTLLSEAPEQFLRDHFTDLQVEWVEANLRGGDTVVWTRIGSGADAPGRVYVLSPGQVQSIGVDLDSGWTAICTSHLGNWHIVGDHALE
ncbi:MAG: hypothetical protein M3069_26310 [Chloroflexota bacterium]|nr:hypothetical protein [Chloroflexota bacterium]